MVRSGGPFRAAFFALLMTFASLITACGGGEVASGVTSVVVSPQTATVTIGASTALNATVTFTNTASPAVIWSVLPVKGLTLTPGDGRPSLNSVTVTGVTAGSYTVTATSSADPSQSGTASVTVNTPVVAGFPTVSGISPAFGPLAGGTSVTVTGTNFNQELSVRFGPTRASSVIVNSSTSLTAVSPAGTGTVDVTVVGATGTSAAIDAGRFTYMSASVSTGGDFAEYAVPTVQSIPRGIAAGPDGNLWFAEVLSNKIGRITPAGVLTEYPLPSGAQIANYRGVICRGPDGNMWFSEGATGKVGKITPSGVITEYIVSLPVNSGPGGTSSVTAGPDGNVWFSDYGRGTIGKITPAGVVTEYSLSTAVRGGGGTAPGGRSKHTPDDLTLGPDMNLWYVDSTAHIVGKMTPAGVVTEYFISPNSDPDLITTGPDGNLWFTESTISGYKLGKITTAGVITIFNFPEARTVPLGITAGPDGNVWFSDNTANKIGSITPAGVVTEYNVPTVSSDVFGITTGPDGNLWFTESAESAGKIGVFRLPH